MCKPISTAWAAFELDLLAICTTMTRDKENVIILTCIVYGLFL